MAAFAENPEFPKLNLDKDTGLGYYHFRKGYPLYKASKRLDEYNSLTLHPNKLYFFGLKNEDPKYIEDFENEYGIIFEFEITKPLKLLAMDDQITREILHKSVTEQHIKEILEKHYGVHSNIRISDSEPDRELSKYLCENGYQGYAINTMDTDSGGIFHPELMICNAADSIKLVKQVTVQQKVTAILQEGRMKKLEEERKNARKESKLKLRKEKSPTSSPISLNKGFARLFSDYDSPKSSPSRSFRLFPESPKSPKSPKSPTKKRKGGKGRKTSKRRK